MYNSASDEDPAASPVSPADACQEAPTVYVHDGQACGLQAVRGVVRRCGACPSPLEDAQKRQGDWLGKRSGIALVALEPDCLAREVERVRVLKQNNFKVICYEDGIRLRPIGERCEVLLAGALHMLDSAESDFAESLRL